MRLRFGLLLILVAFPAGDVPAPAEEPPAPPLLAPVATERVEVDLVVRDKAGRLVRDLSLAEVEVLEDGVRQDVDSLLLVEHGSEAGDPAPEPVFVALVFDRLGPAARRFAHQAALEYLSGPRPGSEVGVFAIDRGLFVLQGFTDDALAVREAVEAMTSRSATTLAGPHERQLTQQRLPRPRGGAGPGPRGSGGEPGGARVPGA